MKHLYKSNNNKVIFGVFGGLGEYYDIDPTVLRLAYLLFLIVTAFLPGIIIYIVASMIVPNKVKKILVYEKINCF